MPAVCCKLHRRHVLLLLFILLLLFGSILLLQELVKTLFSADQFLNVTSISSSGVDVTSPIQLNSSTVDDADECLPALQNLSNGALVQCIRQPSSSLQHNECMSASNFWDRQCYLNITESVRFYHLGKGGGGTIFFSLIENGIYLQRDHPRPKHGIDQLLNGPVKTLIVNIRDPVDRFVSAFNWRSLLFCQRDGETRKKYPTEVDVKDRKMHQPHLQPQHFCFDASVYPQEAKIIQRLYNDDINQLAESLCEESERFDRAVNTTKFISHAKLSLFQWLHFLVVNNGTSTSLIKPQGLDKLMAITVEKRKSYNNTSSLLEQTSEAAQQLFFDHGVDEQTFHRLQRHKRNLQKKRVSDMMVHTSSIPIHNNVTKGHALGTVGECCLARFLENDYRLIQSIVGDENSIGDDLTVISRLNNAQPIIGKACEWGSERRRQLCWADLQSMLDRRVKFLDRSLGACRDFVSNY